VRLILYSLAVLAASVVAGLLVTHRASEADERDRVTTTRASVERLRTEIQIRRALETATLNEHSWPERPDPAWFADGVPSNDLLDRNRPWLEVAPASQASLDHPPERVAADESVAAFWYNPYLGVVRARAPERVSDKRSMELYNEINAARVSSLLDIEWLALDELRREGVRRATALAATNRATSDEYPEIEPGELAGERVPEE